MERKVNPLMWVVEEKEYKKSSCKYAFFLSFIDFGFGEALHMWIGALVQARSCLLGALFHPTN